MRRAEKGQCFHRPYLGCREFAAHFDLWPSQAVEPKAIDESRDLGFMLYDIDFSGTEPMPLWFRAQLRCGQVYIPSPDSAEVHR